MWKKSLFTIAVIILIAAVVFTTGHMIVNSPETNSSVSTGTSTDETATTPPSHVSIDTTPTTPEHPVSPAHPITPTPVIASISPSSAPVGATIIVTGNGFTSDNKILFNGNVASGDNNLGSSNSNQTITATVPESASADCKPYEACPMYAMLITPGTYKVQLENEHGKSNTVEFTVTNQ